MNERIAEAAHGQVTTLKLSVLTSQEFRGDPKLWREFRSDSESAVHNQNFPEIQKLNCLLSYLKEVTLRAVQDYEKTSENYWIVRELLMRKFGDLSIIKTEMHGDLKVIKWNDCDIEATVESIERVLRQLEAFSEDVEHRSLEISSEKSIKRGVTRKGKRSKLVGKNTSRLLGQTGQA